MLAEVEKNDKYVGHFPELWFSRFSYSELARKRASRAAEVEAERKERKRRESRQKCKRTQPITFLYTSLCMRACV